MVVCIHRRSGRWKGKLTREDGPDDYRGLRRVGRLCYSNLNPKEVDEVGATCSSGTSNTDSLGPRSLHSITQETLEYFTRLSLTILLAVLRKSDHLCILVFENLTKTCPCMPPDLRNPFLYHCPGSAQPRRLRYRDARASLDFSPTPLRMATFPSMRRTNRFSGPQSVNLWISSAADDRKGHSPDFVTVISHGQPCNCSSPRQPLAGTERSYRSLISCCL